MGKTTVRPAAHELPDNETAAYATGRNRQQHNLAALTSRTSQAGRTSRAGRADQAGHPDQTGQAEPRSARVLASPDCLRDIRARHQSLKEERQSWEADWKKLAAHFLPRKCRLEQDQYRTNQGGLRGEKLDSTGFYAMRDLAAGLHGGLTSPARPWFNLTLQNQASATSGAIKTWLDAVTQHIRFVYHQSNFYNAVASLYQELGAFGTAFMFEVEDEKTGVRFIPVTAGEYWLDTDSSGRVDTVFRIINMTLRQMEQEFGLENLPEQLRTMFETASNWNSRFHVVHAVFPDPRGTITRVAAEANPWASVYYLDGHAGSGSGGLGGRSGIGDRDCLLRVGGYPEFPGFGVRWDVTGNDVYGKGPAYDAIADSVLLQQMTHSLLKAMHKEIDPPLAAPAGLENVSLLPGAVNPVNTVTGAQGQSIYPIAQVRHNIQGTYQVISQIQNKVRTGLFNDLFRMLLGSDRRQITAKEVAAREEEKLILIGPVLERLNNEFFIPLTSRTFSILWRAGKLPPAPDGIEGLNVDVQFVSILAQAQKMVSTGSVEQFVSFVGNISRFTPDALDAVDLDATIDNFHNFVGAPADMLVSRDQREATRQQRAEQQAQAQQQAEAVQAMQAVKDLGGMNMDGSLLGAVAGGGGQQH